MKLMGNRFEISVVTADENFAGKAIGMAVAEIQRIEALLTTFNSNSDTCRINSGAGLQPVPVSRETLELVKRSLRLSQLTQGAFDITYGSVDKQLWNFDRNMTALPGAAAARQMVRLINYRNVITDDAACTVFLKEKGMRIGFGGIGKGYAAEKAKQLLQQLGVKSGIVNASGDLTAWGASAWRKAVDDRYCPSRCCHASVLFAYYQ